MTTTSSTTDVVHVEPLFTEVERAALAGFLGGYTGLTRDAYALDLRQYASWWQQNGPHLFQARRAWTTSPTRSVWTATRSARCWSPPVCERPRARLDLPAGDQRATDIEALGTDIDALGIERGHRTLTVLRQGSKIVTIHWMV